jgi:hypothetical protein
MLGTAELMAGRTAAIWQLNNDHEAAKMFEGDLCGVAQMPGWKVEKKNIR